MAVWTNDGDSTREPETVAVKQRGVIRVRTDNFGPAGHLSRKSVLLDQSVRESDFDAVTRALTRPGRPVFLRQ